MAHRNTALLLAVVLFASAISGQQAKKPSEPYWDSVYSKSPAPPRRQ